MNFIESDIYSFIPFDLLPFFNQLLIIPSCQILFILISNELPFAGFALFQEIDVFPFTAENFTANL